MNKIIDWLQVFDRDDLLIFLSELIEASYVDCIDKMKYELPCVVKGYENNTGVVIHEWYESALAIQSEDVRAAFDDVSDEVELSKPGE